MYDLGWVCRTSIQVLPSDLEVLHGRFESIKLFFAAGFNLFQALQLWLFLGKELIELIELFLFQSKMPTRFFELTFFPLESLN